MWGQERVRSAVVIIILKGSSLRDTVGCGPPWGTGCLVYDSCTASFHLRAKLGCLWSGFTCKKHTMKYWKSHSLAGITVQTMTPAVCRVTALSNRTSHAGLVFRSQEFSASSLLSLLTVSHPLFPSSARTQGRFAARDRQPISFRVGSRRPGLLLDRRQFHSAQVSLGLAEEAWESAGALTGLPGWRQKACWHTPADTCRSFAHLSQTNTTLSDFLQCSFFLYTAICWKFVQKCNFLTQEKIIITDYYLYNFTEAQPCNLQNIPAASGLWFG